MTQQEQINDYLNQLRDAGIVNMMGAGPYLEKAFSLSRRKARAALLDWIQSFRKAAA